MIPGEVCPDEIRSVRIDVRQTPDPLVKQKHTDPAQPNRASFLSTTLKPQRVTF